MLNGIRNQKRREDYTPRYNFTCNLILEPPKPDRFYMDMRAYSINPEPPQSPDDLIWRGIYLVFEINLNN